MSTNTSSLLQLSYNNMEFSQGEHKAFQDFQDWWQKVAICSEALQTHLLVLLTRQQ